MKTTIHITLLIISTMIFISCQKFGTVKVEGQVYEYGTEKPVSGAVITLWEFHASGMGSGGSYYVIDSVITDSNGYYEYEGIDEEILHVYMTVKKDKYFETFYYNETGYKDSFNPDEGDAFVDIELDPEAYLTIDIVDNPEIDGYGVDITCDDILYNWKNFNQAQQIKGNVRGNRFVEIWYDITLVEPIPFVKDSIYINAFQEKTYTIEY